jgi:hypothetical protein
MGGTQMGGGGGVMGSISDFSDMLARMKALENGQNLAPPVNPPIDDDKTVVTTAPTAEPEAAEKKAVKFTPGLYLWLDPRNGKVTVVGFAARPTKDIREGDYLKEVDGLSVKGWPTDNIQALLAGSKDSRVELMLKRGFPARSVRVSLRRSVPIEK